MNHLVAHLRALGERPAVHTADRTISYAGLGDLVAGAARDFAGERALILLRTRNDIATLVHYLGALAGGHVVLPVPSGSDHSDLLATYRPDILIDTDGTHRRGAEHHRLHPDLALLLSTSGSTGSPKLVRLSAGNLLANARSIAEYLDIRDTDCAATTLPMSYCYGLSVIHSHLLRGAALILTDLSVIDDEFWDLFARHRGTSFAGVPYTFDLLDRIGFAEMHLPHLRYITQAGGRLEPDRVRRFAALGQQRGWRLFVMYGATEATARMAYLPPELATTRPEAIGRAIPGGRLWIDAEASEATENPHSPDGEIGELVYAGPNVMMGYAHSSADLALAAGPAELRTGDLARRGPDGLFEVVGRANRFAKLFGLRVDLQRLENSLSERGITALCTTSEQTLAVATTDDARTVHGAVAEITGLPPGSVRATTVGELPMLATGKPDYPAVLALQSAPAPAATPLQAVFADVLHRDPADIDPGASFVDLGGNSLTYVMMSVRLEKVLHGLPHDWHRRSLRELERLRIRGRRWTATLETSVVLRAVAIVLIVGSHAELFEMWGGAHILLGVAGYNFGRFCLTSAPRRDRIRRLRSTIAWIAVPAVGWVALTMTYSDDYAWSNLLLANKFLGPDDSMTAGRLWFIEVLVWILVLLTILLCIPAVDRLERRRPFALAVGFLVAGLAVRYAVPGPDAWFSMLSFWFFTVGWAVSKSSAVWQRAVITALLGIGLFGYFADPVREVLVFTGIVLLIWLPSVRLPVAVTGGLAALADASLYIYLTHFQVYPLFGEHRLLGVLAALLFGVALARAMTWLRRHRSAIMPSWTRVAAMTPSARSSAAVITPRPQAAAGDRDSSRFH